MPTDRGAVLLPIARAAISHALNIPCVADESAPWLHEPGACFVTLTQQGQLRGCIGSLEAYRSLLADIKSNAVAAALHDPRFMPLTARELGITRIEISLLTPPSEIIHRDETDARHQLRCGTDGVIFEFGPFRSTFLPQVWEQLPEPDEFMAHLKRKAGMPADFWDEGVRLSRYSVSKFIEEEH
ncbi:MAG: AmmeMemoRadiSam system protein A [Gallionella sp.]|nr:AmmeMemoRadiSam system protein A [Gallionella sp.]